VGSVAQSVLSRTANGEYLSINLGWGFAVMFGVFLSGGVSGKKFDISVLLHNLNGSLNQVFLYINDDKHFQ